MNAHTKIILRSDYQKKDRSQPICLRATINRKVKVYSLKISATSKNWNSNKGLVKALDPDSYRKNSIIKFYLKKTNDIIFNYRIQDKLLTIAEFDRIFKHNRMALKSFCNFAESEINDYKEKYSRETLRFYKYQITKLRQFSPDLAFNDITVRFIKDYENYMLSELGNNPNTVSKTLKFVKSILNKAIQEGIIKENVFNKIPIKRYEGHREFLTLNEIAKLESMYNSKELKGNKKNVLSYFLFACYTGLRYYDIKNLKYKHLRDDDTVLKPVFYL